MTKHGKTLQISFPCRPGHPLKSQLGAKRLQSAEAFCREFGVVRPKSLAATWPYTSEACTAARAVGNKEGFPKISGAPLLQRSPTILGLY